MTDVTRGGPGQKALKGAALWRQCPSSPSCAVFNLGSTAPVVGSAAPGRAAWQEGRESGATTRGTDGSDRRQRLARRGGCGRLCEASTLHQTRICVSVSVL